MSNTLDAKPFVIENADKLLLLFVPYLIIVSCLYYYGYWGTLGIDIFPYMGVEDLIKGVAFPLRISLIRLAFFAGLIILLCYAIYRDEVSEASEKQAADSTSTKKEMSGKSRSIQILISLIISILFIYYIYLSATDAYDMATGNYIKTGIPSFVSFLLLFAIMLITDRIAISQGYAFQTHIEHGKIIHNNIPKSTFVFTSIFIIIFLIPYSFITGYYDARDITEYRQYSYVKRPAFQDNEQLNKRYNSLLYLGKFGDYHFFSTVDQKQRIIINSDSLPTLLLYHYNVEIEAERKVKEEAKSPAK
ncbi:hypothetical protein [Hymenobacter psychrotolerans]|uniref:Uncharacterized protein n=1 Tax=Hymenobacter psychrotolerans DSM 18569 TaxID=1121959 RepID=A0A1M6Z747_9BACT|nr:hypothetical protein [Hymenobacter psychrotolerans]SHL26242.1 hypothetical protein SAMN02746009_02442 [Hymenobacter psychrotolerans DSM 18569]